MYVSNPQERCSIDRYHRKILIINEVIANILDSNFPGLHYVTRALLVRRSWWVSCAFRLYYVEILYREYNRHVHIERRTLNSSCRRAKDTECIPFTCTCDWQSSPLHSCMCDVSIFILYHREIHASAFESEPRCLGGRASGIFSRTHIKSHYESREIKVVTPMYLVSFVLCACAKIAQVPNQYAPRTSLSIYAQTEICRGF